MCSFKLQKIPRLPFLLLERSRGKRKKTGLLRGGPGKQNYWPPVDLSLAHRPGCPSLIRYCKVHSKDIHVLASVLQTGVALSSQPSKPILQNPYLSKQGQKLQDRQSRLCPLPTVLKTEKLGKGTCWLFFQEKMERALQPIYKKKMDLSENMSASCSVTLTPPHRPA